MCRFLAYSGPSTFMQEFLLDSSYSLVNQSKHARMRFEPVNGDGFGVGWYPLHDDPIPGTFVSIEPAWSNRNLREIAAKIPTRHFFAHIRDATIGMPVSQANCHPFQSGSYLWMHNGHLDEFDKCRRLLMDSLSDTSFNMIKGNTDTEHLFALFMDEVEHQQVSDSGQLLEALSRTIVRINNIRKESACESEAHMNFALSNGVCSLFTRLSMNSEMAPPTLHYQQKHEALIVASEPLSDTGDWQQVNNGEVLIQESGKPMRIEALNI